MQDPRTRIDRAEVVELPNDREAIGRVIDNILDRAHERGVNQASVFAIRLAIEEAITNAFVHGHKGLGSDIPVLVEYRIDDNEVLIAVEDQGPGFQPEKLPDPTLDENLSKPSGRGVMLMRAYMNEVEFNDRGNRVVMRYQVN